MTEKNRDQMPFIRIGTVHEQADTALFMDNVFRESVNDYWTQQARGLLHSILSRLMRQCKEEDSMLPYSELIAALRIHASGISADDQEQNAILATVNNQLLKWRASVLKELS